MLQLYISNCLALNEGQGINFEPFLFLDCSAQKRPYLLFLKPIRGQRWLLLLTFHIYDTGVSRKIVAVKHKVDSSVSHIGFGERSTVDNTSNKALGACF